VRLFLGEHPVEADHGMGLERDLAQQVLRRLALGREVLEQVERGAHDLLGGLGAALVAAGAVGDDHERGALELLAGDDRDAILLLGPVAEMLAGGRVE
jgi:hypothetical protein